MATMAQIREALQNSENKETTTPQSQGDNASFPFWKAPMDSTTTIRFLKDADEDNFFFWRERQIIRLPFAGVVGDHNEPVQVQIPCVDMFGDVCPVISATKSWWKDPAKVDLARAYYKKRSYLFQGFVIKSDLTEEETPENPIRRFVISPSIFELIKASLLSPDMEDSPVDFDGGREFKLTKTQKGDYANYSTSSWSFKSRPLDETERAAIDSYGLFDLKEFLGKRPDADGIAMIKEMFEQSLAGQPFDAASFGAAGYRAYKVNGENFVGGNNKPAPQRTEQQAQAAPTASSAATASNILDRLKAAQKSE